MAWWEDYDDGPMCACCGARPVPEDGDLCLVCWDGMCDHPESWVAPDPPPRTVTVRVEGELL